MHPVQARTSCLFFSSYCCCVWQVADFGLSKVLDALSVLPGTKTITGTPQYMAPEVMLSQPQGMRVDIYSAAIVMWEILTGCIPWKGMDIVQIIHQVTQEANKTMKPPPGRPRLEQQHVLSALPGYVQLMHECWAQIPSERPSTDQCVQQLEAIQLAQRGIRAGGQPAFQQPTQPGSRLPASSAQPFHMDRQVACHLISLACHLIFETESSTPPHFALHATSFLHSVHIHF